MPCLPILRAINSIEGGEERERERERERKEGRRDEGDGERYGPNF